MGCRPESEVPTYRVEPRAFEHRVTAEGILQAGRTTRLTVPTQVAGSVRLAWILDEGTIVEGDTVVARFDRRAMEERLADGSLDRSIADRKIDRSRVEKSRQVGDLEAAAEVSRLELEHAREFQRTDADVFSRRELLDDEIDEELATERRDHALANASTQRELASTELGLLEIERRRALQTIEEARTGLEALEVRAPHGGLLTYVRWRGEEPRVGAEMFRGQALAEIPDLDSLEAEVWVLEADAGGLRVGQRAEVLIEARPDLVLAGEVARVDPVAQPRLRGSPIQYFGVGVRFVDPADLPALKPGQRVRATLFLESIDGALVVPRQAIFEEAGESRVWVRRRGGFEPAAVDLAATGLGLAVVSRGLAAGDEIALRRPGGEAGGDAAVGSGEEPEAEAEGLAEAG